MRVLLAVNFETISRRAVEACADRTWPVGTILRVLGVVEMIPPSAAELWYDAGGDLKEVIRTRAARTEDIVQEAAAVLRSQGLTTETKVRVGRRRKVIALEAKSWRPDIIIDVMRGVQRLS